MAEAELRIMVVGNSRAERCELISLIESCPSYHVVAETSDGRTALALASRENLDVVVVAVNGSLPDISALGLFHLFTRNHPRTQILVQTSHNSREWIVDSLREGVRAFVLQQGAKRHLLPALKALSDHRPYWEGAVGDELLEELLQGGARPLPASLSDIERRILQLTAEGQTARGISEALGVSAEAAERMRAGLRRKLGLKSVADLVRYIQE